MEKDYTKYSFRITLLVIVLLIGISFIPPFSVGGINFKRANIFSDLYKFEDNADGEEKTTAEDQAFLNEMDQALAAIDTVTAAVTAEPVAPTNIDNSWDLGGSAADDSGAGASAIQGAERVVPIEDYYPETDGVTISDFCELLGTETNNRIVRIAFLGDSYIEGDIITADVRNLLQQAYGGGGVGFVPFSTPLATNRPTIKHSYSGWTNYNLINKSSAPANVKERFFVSGIVSVPSNGAKATYTSTSFRERLSKANTARLIFTNRGNAEISMVVNDSITKVFTPDSSSVVQQIRVSGTAIKSLKVTVNKASGFYGYGVVLEGGRGVSVDNYSIRGNSGLALFGTNSQVNSQINRLLGYDLIVIQYGLNVMQSGVNKYTKYGEQLRKIINYVKACFPRSAIVVLGVGDRSTKQDGVYVSMPAVRGMIAEQRAAAQDCGVAFWDMCEAMGGPGSMSRYVANGWAAKDFTHLSFQGGKQIATQFVNALASYKQFAEYSVQREFELEDSLMSVSAFNDMVLSGDSIFESMSVPENILNGTLDFDGSGEAASNGSEDTTLTTVLSSKIPEKHSAAGDSIAAPDSTLVRQQATFQADTTR